MNRSSTSHPDCFRLCYALMCRRSQHSGRRSLQISSMSAMVAFHGILKSFPQCLLGWPFDCNRQRDPLSETVPKNVRNVIHTLQEPRQSREVSLLHYYSSRSMLCSALSLKNSTLQCAVLPQGETLRESHEPKLCRLLQEQMKASQFV